MKKLRCTIRDSRLPPMAWLYSLSVHQPAGPSSQPYLGSQGFTWTQAAWRGGVGRSSFLNLPSVSSAVEDSCGFLKQEIALGKPEGKLLAL